MGQANQKLWDAVEENDAVGLLEVLKHKEADVNYERTFKTSSSQSLFDAYLSTTNSASLSPPISKTPITPHEKLVNKMGLGENNDKDTITPLHSACEKGLYRPPKFMSP